MSLLSMRGLKKGGNGGIGFCRTKNKITRGSTLKDGPKQEKNAAETATNAEEENRETEKVGWW
jgi:hypothetical protein